MNIFVLLKLKQLFVCPPSTSAAVKLCRLIILILFLCLASAPTLSPTFMLYDVFPQRLECLHSLSDWRCGWCHFSLKDVADLILENPHYWSSIDASFHSTLSWCLCHDVFDLFLFWSMMKRSCDESTCNKCLRKIWASECSKDQLESSQSIMMSVILSLLIRDDVISPPTPTPTQAMYCW